MLTAFISTALIYLFIIYLLNIRFTHYIRNKVQNISVSDVQNLDTKGKALTWARKLTKQYRVCNDNYFKTEKLGKIIVIIKRKLNREKG